MKRATYLGFNRGFTLMEILIVIVLMGFLIAMITGSFTSSQIKSRDARRKSDLHQIMLALEAYFNDKGRYPSTSADGEGKISGCGAGATNDCTWGGTFSETGSANKALYMVTLPPDPTSGRRYFYAAPSNGVSYQLYARLENKDDIDAVKNGSSPGQYQSLWCDNAHSIECNYGISSTNTTQGTGRTVVAD